MTRPGADLLEGRDLPALSREEIGRYGRHLILPEVGREGQRRLKAARVLIVGAGGLGSPLALYLAAAGVGTLGLVDFDTVDATNLQRQILYGTGDVGRAKLDAAVERLGEVNPHVKVVAHRTRLTSDNALDLMRDYDLVADGSDNFPTRYLVNDACVLLGKPNVYGSIFRFEGQVAVFWGARGPCYRCLFAEPPPPGLVPSCAEAGVLGVLPGVIGALQANEAVKLLLAPRSDGIRPAIGRLTTFDALRLRFRELRLEKDPGCPVCSERPTQTGLIDYEAFCGLGEEEREDPAEDAAEELPFQIGVRELDRWLEEDRNVTLLDVRTPMEADICRLDGSILIPLHELPERLDEIGRPFQADRADGDGGGDRDGGRVIVAYCHHGFRSAQAVQLLRSHGVKAVNLGGGIDAWSVEVDPSLARY
ncbi:MAG: molybdopterin-synthase adenylyltransferase MoeB [Acidobacteriota bacterium]